LYARQRSGAERWHPKCERALRDFHPSVLPEFAGVGAESSMSSNSLIDELDSLIPNSKSLIAQFEFTHRAVRVHSSPIRIHSSPGWSSLIANSKSLIAQFEITHRQSEITHRPVRVHSSPVRIHLSPSSNSLLDPSYSHIDECGL